MAFGDFEDIFQADLAFALDEAGSVVAYNGHIAGGILVLEPSDILQMGAAQYAVHDTEITLTVATGSLGALTSQSTLTVDGVSYLVHRWIPINDGLETKIWLSEAS